MAISKKTEKLIKTGFKNCKTKKGFNYWRFIFNALEESTSKEQRFFIELEYINPNLSPDNPVLGFKPRMKISEDDLQYVLAGTSSAKTLETESLVIPSYCVIRIGKVGAKSVQLCDYYGLKDCSFKQSPFELGFGSNIFTMNKLSGSIIKTKDEIMNHPEFLCDGGKAEWDISYDLVNGFSSGYKAGKNCWFPGGALTKFSGKITFDNETYLIDEKHSFGYSDRMFGIDFPKNWFHVSSNNITSNITGKRLFDSHFAVQGVFNGKIAFIGNFEGNEIIFDIKTNKAKFLSVWDCVQTPENGEFHEETLHWSVSVHNREFVIDIDLYCYVKDLFNRKLEMPEGNRKIINMLQGFNGNGEIKLYKKIGKNLEQLEYAKIEKAVCEFGEEEDGEK